MLQNPRVFVEEEDSVEAGGEGGIDVAFGAVANHPARVRFEFVASDDSAIGGGILFRDDLDAGEVGGEAGAAYLIGLLGVVALGHHDELVPGGKIAEGFFDTGEEFDFLFSDGAGEADDPGALLVIHGDGTEALEAGDERAGETGQAVAVSKDGFALDSVEGLADLSGRVLVMIEIADEGGDGALKVDV